MNATKVRELCDEFMDASIADEDRVITEWLEQNQPVKNMFDWTDGEIVGFAIELVGEDFSNLQEVINNLQSMFKAMRSEFDKAKSKPSLSNEQVYSELYQEYQDVKKELEQLKSQQFSPDWSTAPEWADWLAQNEYGEWSWFESEPKPREYCWWHTVTTDSKRASANKNWQQTLQERPKPEPTQQVMTPEKVRELVHLLWLNEHKTMIYTEKAESVITEWIEQNQPKTCKD